MIGAPLLLFFLLVIVLDALEISRTMRKDEQAGARDRSSLFARRHEVP